MKKEMSKAIGSVFAAGYSGDEFNDEEEKKKIRDRVQNYIRTAQPIDTESYLNNANGYLNMDRLKDIGETPVFERTNGLENNKQTPTPWSANNRNTGLNYQTDDNLNDEEQNSSSNWEGLKKIFANFADSTQAASVGLTSGLT